MPRWVEAFTLKEPLKIRGIAIKAGKSRNLNVYVEEELKAAAETLKGKPVYIEHVSAGKAVGRVLNAWWDEAEKAILYEAEIYDEEVAEKIRAGLISHVSIAADYEVVEPVDGRIPRGLSFRELSLVAVPGIPETSLEVVENLLEKLNLQAQERETMESSGEKKAETGENQELKEVREEVKRLREQQEKLAENLSRLPEVLKPEEVKGKGVVEASNRASELLERLKAGSLREQWLTPIRVAEHELAAHLRQYVNVTDLLTGKAGDTVNIPYVKDFDMDILTSVGESLTEKTGILGTLQTTLREAGAYIQISYADLEKFDAELLARAEEVFSKAALRAEDRVILDTIMASGEVPELDKSGEAEAFKAEWVAEALSLLQSNGKQVSPGEAILVLSPAMYEALLKEVAGSQSLAYISPEAVREGRFTEFMGVRIVVAHYLPEHDTANHKKSAFLMKAGEAVTLAPKRELQVETERDTVNRKVKLTGTHTFGVVLVDPKAVVEIKTPATG